MNMTEDEKGQSMSEAASDKDAGEPSEAARSHRGVFVPAWVFGIIVVLLLAGLGFGIGRWTDTGGDHDSGPFRGHDRGSEAPGDRRGPNNGPGRNGAPGQGVFLGVSVQDSSNPAGAQVLNVASGSPAATAGLKAGDVITAVDGNAVTSASQLASRVQSHSSGGQASITYTRSGSSTTVQVTLANRPSTSAPAA